MRSSQWPSVKDRSHQFSLFTWSPYPGVSTMFNRNFTPFSTMTIKVLRLIENGGVKKRTMRNCLDFSSLPDRFIRCEPTLRADKVRREDGVYESRLSQSSLACRYQKVKGGWTRVSYRPHKCRRKDESYAPTTMTLNWKPRFKSLCSICDVMESKPT